ncbi:protein POLR1D-like [Gadus macrocephalus]|uniref:protein POLR1D-like n=1 Tax=Gadus macrocephalus TaxID=80720 RepID=UPI0028CB3B78|nr:protein POLR1D-like [Gadus macrocephalus]
MEVNNSLGSVYLQHFDHHTMADDNDLEKRAIDELLRETNRARARVETMGPSGWMKCPLRRTNKRFLVNTLRSSGLQRRPTGPTAGQAAAAGCLRSDSLPGGEHHDKTPPRDSSPRDPGRSSHRHHKRHLISRRREQEDGNKSGHFHKVMDRRGGGPAEGRDTEAQRLHSGHSSSRSHSPLGEYSRGSQSGRTRSSSPAAGSQSGRSQK